MRVWLVADDLTGACDAAVCFAEAGFETVVPLGKHVEGQVTAINTASRELSSSMAFVRVKAAFERAPEDAIFFKKIDSVMRGNIAAEIRAAMSVRPGMIWFTPAFPLMGRFVDGFTLFVEGQKKIPLIEFMEEAGFKPNEVVYVEATEQSHLESAVRSALEENPVFVGSGGFARELAWVLGGRKDQPPFPKGDGIAMVVVGTDHPVTNAQVEALETSGLERWEFQRLCWKGADDGAMEAIRRFCLDATKGGLFVSGGETAEFLLRELDADALRLEREVVPGLPMGRIVGGEADGLAIVTKSGGFGGLDAMCMAVEALNGAVRIGQ